MSYRPRTDVWEQAIPEATDVEHPALPSRSSEHLHTLLLLCKKKMCIIRTPRFSQIIKPANISLLGILIHHCNSRMNKTQLGSAKQHPGQNTD